jgi:PadR family transcriptional regulator PadR
VPATPQSDLLQGTLDLVVLKALALQPLHGVGISRRIAQLTRGTFDVKAGSLFPALHRMEQSGWLTSSWGESETHRRAKFYAMTKAGRRQLDAETERWQWQLPCALRKEVSCSVHFVLSGKTCSAEENLTMSSTRNSGLI